MYRLSRFKDMIDQGIDAIFLTPVDWEAITPALEGSKRGRCEDYQCGYTGKRI